MIAFDTNLLVRLVVEDDPVQWQTADDLLARCVADEERCLINVLVLCERSGCCAADMTLLGKNLP